MDNATSPFVADTSEEGFESYRSVSKAAVLSMFFSLLSFAAFAFAAFTFFALLGAALGYFGLRAIRHYPNELTGRIPALLGILLGVGVFVGSVTMYSVIYATEVPDGYERISFESLKASTTGPDQPPADALLLDGKEIFVKGYVYPSDQRRGLKRFVLVPDLGTCCFGGQPKLTHMIEVTLTEPLRVDYSVKKRKLAGKIHIDSSLKPVSGLGGVYYQMTADYIK